MPDALAETVLVRIHGAGALYHRPMDEAKVRIVIE